MRVTIKNAWVLTDKEIESGGFLAILEQLHKIFLLANRLCEPDAVKLLYDVIVSDHKTGQHRLFDMVVDMMNGHRELIPLGEGVSYRCVFVFQRGLGLNTARAEEELVYSYEAEQRYRYFISATERLFQKSEYTI